MLLNSWINSAFTLEGLLFMSTSTNIDKFNDLTGEIFTQLYELFPEPAFLSAGKFVGTDNVYAMNDNLGMEMPTKETTFFMSTIQWLANEDYLRIGDKGDAYFGKVVLTNKALTALNATPDSLLPSLGSQLVQATKQGAKGVTRTVITETLRIGVELGAKAIGILD